MKKLFGKILSFTLALVLCLTSFSAIGCKGGNEFKNLIVGGVTTTYRVGDDINFDNIVVKVEYTDAEENKTLSKNDYTIKLPNGMSKLSDLTDEVGTYTIKIVYLDPLFDGEKREKSITINVVAQDVEYIEGETLFPTSFTLPGTYGVYLNNKNNVTNVRSNAEKDTAFEGKFMDVEDKNYYVGTDNGFKFLPNLRVNDAFRKFTANISISVYDESATQYVPLNASEPVNKVVSYSLDGNVVATVDIYNHVYKFEDALDGKKVTVSVEPSATIYEWDEGALSAEFVIVKDAYNVHNATEFSVIDNVESDHNWAGGNITDVDWKNWKTEHNMNVETDGVILHDNITVTKEDLPENFFWTNPNGKHEYTDAEGHKMYEDTYTYDNSDYYWRKIEEGKTFKFLGNYFTVDMNSLPVAASNYVECDASLKYKDNFSNITAFKFEGVGKDKSSLIIKNAMFNGNANVSSFKDTGGDPYYSGGVIMFKYKSTTANIENTTVRTSFIAYFPDGYAISNFNAVKAYDSNQSAMFTYEENEINLTNSYMERAGGPLIMLRDTKHTEVGHYSTLNVKDCYLVSEVCGQELFFTSKGASSMVTQVAQMNQYLQNAGLGSYVKMKGDIPYFNAVVVILCEQNSVDAILGAVDTEGKVVIENGEKKFTATKVSCGYDSVNDLYMAAVGQGKDPSSIANSIMATIKQVQAVNVKAPIFACDENFALATYFNGKDGMEYPVSALYGGGETEVKKSFANSDYVALYQAGMTLVMGLNH